MLIEVVQSAVFGALTTGRIKPHEVLVIEGDHIGTLAGKLSDLRYLVERELIEDEPTSDEEESEDAPEECKETAEEEAPEAVESEELQKEESPYKYEMLSAARNADSTPVLPSYMAYKLIYQDGMTSRQVADKYSIKDARSVATAARNYAKKYHKREEPDVTAILMATNRPNARQMEGKDEDI